MSEQRGTTSEGWQAYYQTQAGRPPREFLRRTHERFPVTGLAVDLGCGNGIETVFLLLHGWRVVATDQEAVAIQTLNAQVIPGLRGRLQTMTTSFADLELPVADLIWAGLSLPFCPPEQFAGLWVKIIAALKPGGRFAGDFFGPGHVWAEKEEMTFQTRPEVLALCAGWEVEYFVEEEGLNLTTFSGLQRWHMFSVCARKPV